MHDCLRRMRRLSAASPRRRSRATHPHGRHVDHLDGAGAVHEAASGVYAAPAEVAKSKLKHRCFAAAGGRRHRKRVLRARRSKDFRLHRIEVAADERRPVSRPVQRFGKRCSKIAHHRARSRTHRKLNRLRKHAGSSAVVRGASRASRVGGTNGGRCCDAGVKVCAGAYGCCGGPPYGTPAPCWRLLARRPRQRKSCAAERRSATHHAILHQRGVSAAFRLCVHARRVTRTSCCTLRRAAGCVNVSREDGRGGRGMRPRRASTHARVRTSADGTQQARGKQAASRGS